MNKSNGIDDLPRSEPTLEERIKTHLKKVQADERWKHGDGDKSDRERMRRRALISASLDAIFEHGFREVGPEGIEVEVSSERDVWSDLAIARQDFQNDAKLLDNMERATGCLRPVDKESIIPESTIGAERELMIIWLAVIELWDKARDRKLLKNLSAIMAVAAEATEGAPAAIARIKFDLSLPVTYKKGKFAGVELKMVWGGVPSTAMSMVGREPVKAFVDREQAVAGINGGFFAMAAI